MASFIATPETAKTRRLRATRAEQRICDALGAGFTFNSGAGTEKGDGRKFGYYRIEAKSTRTGAYRLEAGEWHKLSHGCVSAGEIPIFSIDYEQHGLHLLVVDHKIVGETLTYEGMEPKKGVSLTTKNWPPDCAEDEVPHRVVCLQHSAISALPLRWLVVFDANDLLPQLQEDE